MTTHFDITATAKSVAKALGQLAIGQLTSAANLTAFLREAVVSEDGRKLLAEGIWPHCTTASQRDAKKPAESGVFYTIRNALGSEKRMTDPETGECAGTYTVQTKDTAKKDGDLQAAPTLAAKVKPEDKEVGNADALKLLVKWANRQKTSTLGNLMENRPEDIVSTLNLCYEAKAEADRKADAKADADATNEEKAEEMADENAEVGEKQAANG